MNYSVKEIFYTLQGEGAQSGRPAVFCRFSGCNLWSGRELDRSTAICQFCDTDFWGTDGEGGGKFSDAESLVVAIASRWPSNPGSAHRFVVSTGGEPLLQLDGALVSALHRWGFEIAVETNGTVKPPEHLDWICMSPKADTHLVLTSGDELKLIFPQSGADPQQFESLNFTHFYLQPMDGPARTHNTQLALEYCLSHPRWRLSLQTQKLLGIP
jgi:7-carboxy-7-deazaguanine synthase (Cx14CxxC type)